MNAEKLTPRNTNRNFDKKKIVGKIMNILKTIPHYVEKLLFLLCVIITTTHVVNINIYEY